MLDQVVSMFDDMMNLMKHLKKKKYEENTKIFLDQYGHYFHEMTDYVEQSEDKEQAAEELAAKFVGDVKDAFSKKNKIPGHVQTNLNFFMIYYVFPGILLTEHEEAKRIADALCKKWGKEFKNSEIGYTTYDNLYKSFREKIFGIF